MLERERQRHVQIDHQIGEITVAGRVDGHHGQIVDEAAAACVFVGHEVKVLGNDEHAAHRVDGELAPVLAAHDRIRDVLGVETVVVERLELNELAVEAKAGIVHVHHDRVGGLWEVRRVLVWMKHVYSDVLVRH